ncbi:c-type cytochrome [bacterium]|nr:c-type cytochrome [bacterium]
MKPTLTHVLLGLALLVPAHSQGKTPEKPARPTYDQPTLFEGQPSAVTLPFTPLKGERIVLIGNSLGERFIHHGFLEAELHRRYPEQELFFRNMCHPADTPGFRAHPARKTQWAFPGAEKFHPDKQTHHGIGHYPYPDEWLVQLKASTIVAFFGFNESFDGPEGLDNFKAELSAFVDHTRSRSYNGQGAPRLILATPIAFENRSKDYDLPAGNAENENLAIYSKAILDVATTKKVGGLDLFNLTRSWFSGDSKLTLNGCHLNETGMAKLAPLLVEALVGTGKPGKGGLAKLQQAIVDRNWLWHNDYRMLNGVHVWGQRWAPYGNYNYPEEIEKIRQMGEVRDRRIWALAKAEDLSVDDSQTRPLSPVTTNYNRPISYLDTENAKSHFKLPEGYQIELFASEEQFPDLQNPAQMSFDGKGRLWITTVPSYPHYKPGADRPNDKILIFEDTDGDHKADKQTVFADGLHVPIGFELAPEGVYVSQEPYLVLLKDSNGDDVADERIRIVDGFDSHDTHHAISSYSADASGAFYLCEGRFLHSQVETPYGPQRMTDGGLWRFDPHSWRLTRHSQSDYSNPWAVTFDDYGQDFIGDASGGANWWLLALGANVPHGYEIGKTAQFTTHKVRPTSGGEFVSSRHFPDAVQGDYLLNNTIGFLGTKQHSIGEEGSGFTGKHRHDLVVSDDGNYRPADLEFAPDGSLYIVDWHNALIGHMQHSARDPNRNSQYGRIYRVTYPSRPLVEPPVIDGEPIAELLENLKLHEYRARYRTRRELRGHPASEVLPAVKEWAAKLDQSDANYGRHLLEALWVTWAQGQVDVALLDQALGDSRHAVRAAAVRVLRHAEHLIDGSNTRFLNAAADSHARVRLEALVAATWLDNPAGAKILFEAIRQPFDAWMGPSIEAAYLTLKKHSEGVDVSDNVMAQQLIAGQLKLRSKKPERPKLPAFMADADKKLWLTGEEVFHRDAHCVTCHGTDGIGAIPNIYPPLVKSPWVTGDEQRLIKLTLHGLWGKLDLLGKTYDPEKGVPPMTAFGALLNDEEVAGVLTYVRNAWGHEAPAVQPATVRSVREATASRGPGSFYKPEELLKEHPLKSADRK